MLKREYILSMSKTIYLNHVYCYLQRNYGKNYIASQRTSVYMVKVVNTAKLVKVSFSEAETNFRLENHIDSDKHKIFWRGEQK